MLLTSALTHQGLPQAATSELLAALAISLITTSVTYPALLGLSYRIRYWIYHRRLAPLWKHVTDRAPHVRLPRNATPATIAYRLHQRLVELSAAYRALSLCRATDGPMPEHMQHLVTAETTARTDDQAHALIAWAQHFLQHQAHRFTSR
jgi:hypothetical protein